MQNLEDLQLSEQDKKTGIALIIVISLTLLAVGYVICTKGWGQGSIPVINNIRPEAASISRMIVSIGFAISAFIVGLKNQSDIPISIRGYGLALLLAVCFKASNNLHPRHTSDPSPKIYWNVVASMLIPAVFFYCLGWCVRVIVGNR